jgi:transposase
MDREYDFAYIKKLVEEHGYTSHIRTQREEKPKIPGFRARRWIVERPHPWLKKFRRLFIRLKKKIENYLAMLHFACA